MKRFLKGNRTRIIAAVHIFYGALLMITPDQIASITSDSAEKRRLGYFMIGQGVMLYLLRQITTTPPGAKY